MFRQTSAPWEPPSQNSEFLNPNQADPPPKDAGERIAMKYVVRAEWISYDRTNIHNGTIAKEFDPKLPIADLTADTWLVEAPDEAAAIQMIERPWEVQPTQVYAYKPNPERSEGVQHIGTDYIRYYSYAWPLTDEAKEYKKAVAKQRTQRYVDWAKQNADSDLSTSELAKKMVRETGCNVDTAKTHIRRQRQGVKPPSRGGKREGAGRPPKTE